MTVQQLSDMLDAIIPSELSENWDNDGRMVIPNPDAEITGVLVALDATSEAIKFAEENNFNVIITHHPIIFKPLASLTTDDSVGKRVIRAIRSGIAILSYHTRLDSMDGGVNDTLAKIIGLENTEAFLPYGRIGDYEDTDFEEFADTVSEKLGIVNPILVKASDRVKRVALVSGCGKDEIANALNAGADTFITGEAMHNHMIDAKELGINLVLATHYATERVILPILADMVKEIGTDATVFEFCKVREYGI